MKRLALALATVLLITVLFAVPASAAEVCQPNWYSSALCELPATYWIAYTTPREEKKGEAKKPEKAPCEKQSSEKANCPAPCAAGACCHDATVTIPLNTCRPCYTEQGLKSFAALFSAAAERGVENATVRAMNRIEVKPSEGGKK